MNVVTEHEPWWVGNVRCYNCKSVLSVGKDDARAAHGRYGERIPKSVMVALDCPVCGEHLEWGNPDLVHDDSTYVIGFLTVLFIICVLATFA